MSTKTSTPLVQVEGLVKDFPVKSGTSSSGRGVVRAVNGVSFAISAGETLGLVGESGSGKSTTGRLMLRLIDATCGSCRFDGMDVFAISSGEMRALRRKMQIVFQDPYGAFNPRMSVGAIIGEALELREIRGQSAAFRDSRASFLASRKNLRFWLNIAREGWLALKRVTNSERLRRSERDGQIARLLELVQLPTDVRNRYPHEFSGGQRQRIGIARALAVEPTFLVADEPLSALDVSTQAEIVNLLLDLQQRLGLTMLFISHDLSVVRIIADRIAVMYAGRILEVATSSSLFAHPLQPYTQELLDAIPDPDPEPAHRKQRERAAQAAEPADGPAEAGCPYSSRCPNVMEICRARMPRLIDFAAALNESEPHLAACHWAEQEYDTADHGNGASS